MRDISAPGVDQKQFILSGNGGVVMDFDLLLSMGCILHRNSSTPACTLERAKNPCARHWPDKGCHAFYHHKVSSGGGLNVVGSGRDCRGER